MERKWIKLTVFDVSPTNSSVKDLQKGNVTLKNLAATLQMDNFIVVSDREDIYWVFTPPVNCSLLRFILVMMKKLQLKLEREMEKMRDKLNKELNNS